MNLNNFGTDYDKFFTHSTEVSSAKWLKQNLDPHSPVYADETASLRLISFGDGITNTNTAILPSTITKDSCVYLDYANIENQITEAEYGGKQISYNFPIEFLDTNKNLIYDNGGSKIYR